MKLKLSKTLALALSASLIGPITQAQNVSVAQWLNAQPKPAFRAGHTLPRLTRYAYSMPVAARIKLCEDWGYALEYGRENGTYVSGDNGARLNDPTTPEAQMAALAKSDPVRYPLVVTCDRRMPTEAESPAAFVRDANGQIFYSGTFTQGDGTVVGYGPVYSIGAPASSWEMAGEFRAAPFRDMVARGIPISIVLNGGEYSGFPGDISQSLPYLTQDAGLSAQVASSPWGGGNWNNFNSAKRAAMDKIIANQVRSAIPMLSNYVNYTSGGRSERNRFWGIDPYGGYWEHVRGTNVAPGAVDIPSDQAYHGSQNTGFTGVPGGGQRDILTQALNAKAICIATGNPLSYDWVSAGWDGNAADVNRWSGFLKCYYTSGTIGTNTGAYEGPPGNGTYIGHTFPIGSPPEYAKNLAASAYVHALFSQVDTFIRNSDLLPGPTAHSMSPQEPAYEFPTGEDNARVLARKHRTDATWLITAWAADGADRNVSVYIPELGQLTLEARIVGSVYRATLAGSNVTLVRLDNEGARYTAVADGNPVVTPVNLAIPALPEADRLFWISADNGVTADANGKVSAWASQGNSLTLTQTDASKQPTLVSNAISGKPALRFSNGQTWLQNYNTGAAGDAFIGSVNVIAVVTDSAVNGGKRVASGATAGGYEWYGGQGFCMYGDANNNVTVSNGFAIKLAHGSFDSRLNSLLVGESAAAGPGYTFGFTGDIAEIIIYKAMSSAKQTQIFDYLRAKYSISQTQNIANGSFEATPAYGYRYNPGAETQEKVGWVSANGAAIQQNGSALGAATAPDGVQTAVLQGIDNELGCLSQTVSLDGGSYTLSFKAARRAADGSGVQPLKFSLDGVQIGGLITPASTAFENYTTSMFTAKAGKHTLRIEATDGVGGKMTFIDDIASKIITQVGDGSFENPVVTGLQYGTSGNAWTFENHSGIVANGGILGATHAPNGVQAGVLRGSGAGLGGISQTVNFGAGGTYRLSFKAARSNGQIQPVKFSVDGIHVGSLITPTSDGFANYVSDSFTVTPGSHVLRLAASGGAGDNSTLIDQVILSERIYATSLQGGGFETPSVSQSPGKYLQNPTGSGWDFTSKSYIQANGSTRNAANAPEGIQTAQLKGSPGYLGAISQTVGFAAGTYNIRFKAARRLSQIQPVRVSVGGTQIGNLITPTSASFASYSTSSPFTVAAGSHVLRLEATDDTGDTEGNSTFIDEVVIDLVGLTNPTNGGPEPLEARTLKVVRGSGVANFVEYQQLLFESSSAILQTSQDMVDWKHLSEEPTLRFSTQPSGPSTEKVTITPSNADTRRFFRFRYQK